MQIPIISDINKQIGKDYGVYLDHSSDEGVHLRGTFIIDRDGILRHISINDSLWEETPEKYSDLCKPSNTLMYTERCALNLGLLALLL